ncbi:MAG: tRNA (adenosine(37)-N6)-threonylcarbamoyltransferase complex ATPase subunit type 1 TsaE [Candidatus Paceibacterota bacterium]|nr:tRNA (adenosine(37)-N6)-threonylcarbamoyltransferase complex ATPase subunit type 1 TsaE [Candidatus Paceibacterota bacterium]
MQIETAGHKKTQELGKIFAQEILRKEPQGKAVVLALTGDLGGGKTTFCQGIAKGLGVKNKITSPTFNIFKKFKIPLYGRGAFQKKKFQYFYHFDCYRLLGPKDLKELGFKDIVSSPENVVLLEWAEKVEKVLPKDSVWLHFDFTGKTKRKILLDKKGEKEPKGISRRQKVKKP